MPADAIDGDQLRDQIPVIAQDHARWPLTAQHNITMGRPVDADQLATAAGGRYAKLYSLQASQYDPVPA